MERDRERDVEGREGLNRHGESYGSERTFGVQILIDHPASVLDANQKYLSTV